MFKMPFFIILFRVLKKLLTMTKVLTENEISYKIRAAIFEVYYNLGPGLLESAYQETLKYELKKRGLEVKAEVPIPLYYKDVEMSVAYRADIIVEGKVIIELKSVENMAAIHHKQILSYLILANLRLGILVNFNTIDIKGSIFRKVNSLIEDEL